MGQAVTKLYSLASREVKLYNIERRAEKVISKEKPTPAPLHQSTKKELERLDRENVSRQYLQKKNNVLDENLKKVYVTTPDSTPPPLKRIVNPDRPLPLSRHTDREVSFGYSESEERLVPAGKVSLKQALQFIADHESDPLAHNNKVIATQYKLPPNATDDILRHFKMFSVDFSKKDQLNEKKLTEYEKLQFKIKSLSFKNAAEIVDEMANLPKPENDTKDIEEIKGYKDEGSVKKTTVKNNTNFENEIQCEEKINKNTSKSSNKKS